LIRLISAIISFRNPAIPGVAAAAAGAATGGGGLVVPAGGALGGVTVS